MRMSHFEALRPVCPACRAPGQAWPLRVSTVLREEEGHVLEAVLHCSNSHCQREYPVLDGLPVLVANLAELVANDPLGFLMRADLSPTLEGLLGDCMGPNSAFDLHRQRVSTYAVAHYADQDPKTPGEASVLGLIAAGLAALGPTSGPVLDLGCATGRGTFALAEATDGLVLGVDLGISMLRVGAQALRTGRVAYGRRRVGLVYDPRDYPVSLPGAERVDFWMADVLALPFPDDAFATALSLNVLDSVAAPWSHLQELARILRPGGRAFLASPFEWTPAATPVGQWLGGHSQRGPGAGAAEPALRDCFQDGHPRHIYGLRLEGETEMDWRLRVHARCEVVYRVWGGVVAKT